MKNVYLDNSATTQPAEACIKTMNQVSQVYYGNPSSLHHLGVQAEQIIHKARSLIGSLLGVAADALIFTSGGTEGNNLAIKGAAFQYQNRGKHIITTTVEHASVFEACLALEKHFGFRVTYLKVDKEGRISPDDIKAAICDDTILVSVLHVNNETGTIQPIEEMASLLQDYPKILFHTDYVQGLGKVPLSFKHIDLVTMSGHKIKAPKATGLLYVRPGVKLFPLFHGGMQQKGVRPGTENTPGIAALAKAIRFMIEQVDENKIQLSLLRKCLLQGIAELPYTRLVSPGDPTIAVPHIVSLSFPGLKSEVLVHALEEKGIYISTKSACSSKSEQPSRILTAMGLTNEEANGTIRISFSPENTLEEINYVVSVLKAIIPYYQKILRVSVHE